MGLSLLIETNPKVKEIKSESVGKRNTFAFLLVVYKEFITYLSKINLVKYIKGFVCLLKCRGGQGRRYRKNISNYVFPSCRCKGIKKEKRGMRTPQKRGLRA